MGRAGRPFVRLRGRVGRESSKAGSQVSYDDKVQQDAMRNGRTKSDITSILIVLRSTAAMAGELDCRGEMVSWMCSCLAEAQVVLLQRRL